MQQKLLLQNENLLTKTAELTVLEISSAPAVSVVSALSQAPDKSASGLHVSDQVTDCTNQTKYNETQRQTSNMHHNCLLLL